MFSYVAGPLGVDSPHRPELSLTTYVLVLILLGDQGLGILGKGS